jgi:hypothetical protein
LGLRIHGERAGAAPLTVSIGGRAIHYELQVLAAGVPGLNDEFVPGWQKPRTWPVGNGWEEQPRYWQTSDSNWCPKVGCGPVAWAILLAWWDQHGVPACFYANLTSDLVTADSPFTHTEFTAKIKSVYDSLHDYCDVWCFGEFSDQGATMPWDMVEGGPSYLWPPKTLGRLAYKYVWAWDLADPDWSQPSSRIRYANKSGLPAIAGWYWHYSVAYAYREIDFKISPNGPVLFRKRIFKCNMGSKGGVAKWFSGDDMIFGAYLKPQQK